MKYPKIKLKTIPYNLIIIFLLLTISVQAATLQGSIYNTHLSLEEKVLVEINTVPLQKVLATDGHYSLELSPGTYKLKARKGPLEVIEEVTIVEEGTFVLDLFLLPDIYEEELLLQETKIVLFEEETPPWVYWISAFIVILLLIRILRVRKRYGPLRRFRKEVKKEQQKTLEQIKEEIAKEPGYLEQALEILKKHDGRINQKDLRKEMLPLSEAKVSLIVTELEHLGKVEKIKKGRGNIIILKKDVGEELE